MAINRLVSYGLFPATFIAAMAAALVGIDKGLDHDHILAAITLVTVALVAGFERLVPEHPHWNISQDDVGTDLLHGAVSMVMLPQILQLVLPLLILDASVRLAEWAGGSLWPTSWPLLAQLVLTMLVSQLGEYIAHRSMHEVPLLWRLHATHHSPGRLYWLNAARFHPIDTTLLFFLGTTPLVLLGAPAEMFLLLLVWTSVHGLFQHCNIRLRLGPLNYVFSMAELQRWHHSLKLEEANANYGNNILFWDLVFGTVHYPKDRAASADIGLSDLPDFPKDYLGQVLSPWRWKAEADQERPPS